VPREDDGAEAERRLRRRALRACAGGRGVAREERRDEREDEQDGSWS
jgi:hypothetical protein